MSVKLGLYDFFAQLIGGSFFLAAILYVLQKVMPIPVTILGASTSQLVILGTIAYVIGYATSRIAYYWYRLWSPKDLYRQTIEGLSQELREKMEVEIRELDWYTLVAFIKKQNLDMAQDVVQYHAISMMLRSTSFGLLVFAAIFFVELILGKHLAGYLLLSATCLLVSILLVQEAVRYHKFFFRSIYQSVVALLLEADQLSTKFQNRAIPKEHTS